MDGRYIPSNCLFMKKLIGVIVILITLLICVIYRSLKTQQVKARSEVTRQPDPLRDQLILSFLLIR